MRYTKDKSPTRPAAAPPPGKWAILDISDRYDRQLPVLTPSEIGDILEAANAGRTSALCRLADEIEARNWDVGHAMDTRRSALLGCKWQVSPADDSERARLIADRFAKTLQNAGNLREHDSFYDLLSDMMGAVIAPFAVSEIIWDAGDIVGFDSIESRHFTLEQGYEPRLVTRDQPCGVEVHPNKFLFHYNRRAGGDIARYGKIRTLAWLHVFQNFSIKDWLAFVERFGMPFIVARTDQNTYRTERDVMHATIRAFGPSGGGVFTKNTEIQLLQAASGGSDNAYKVLLEYGGDAITKVLLGQTASSSAGGGLSKDNAQSKVRQDILEADARALEGTIRAGLAAPWTYFNFGQDAPVPLFEIQSAAPEDAKNTAEVKEIDARTIQTMSESGWEVEDPKILEERFGIKFKKSAPSPAAVAPGNQPVLDDTLNLKQKYEAMGMAIRAGLLTATSEIEEQTRKELGLPPVSEAVRKAWEATGGIRQPITLKSAEAAAVNEALNVDETPDAVKLAADEAKKKELTPKLEQALDAWLSPLAGALAGLTEDLPDGEYEARLDDILAAPPGDDAPLAGMMAAEMLDGAKTGQQKGGEYAK